MAEAFSLEKVLMNVSQSLEEELQEAHGHGHGHESHGDGHECHECHGDHGEGHSHGHSHGHQRHDYRVSSVGILRDQEVQKEKLGAESALTGEAGRMRAFGALKQREMQRNSTGFLVKSLWELSRLDSFITWLVQTKGPDLYRSKGVREPSFRNIYCW